MLNQNSSSAQTVLITGCSTGIGRAAALRFARAGWQVAATMRDTASAGELAGLGNVLVLPLDVTDPGSVKAAVDATLARFGRIDAVVNNAGYGLFGPFETATDAQIQRQFATNVDGVFGVTRAVLPVMRGQGSGTIVNVSSIGGLITLPFFSLYHATKFAIVGFTESLSFELAPFGIRAKVIAPGGVSTDFAGRSLARTFDDGENAYGVSLSKVMAAMTARRTDYSSPDAIAEVIFNAATDSSDQVLYLAGEDAKQIYAQQRAATEAQKLDMVRQRSGL